MDKVKELKFNGIYRGLVINNLDPTYLCNIQVRVYPMLAQVEDSNLPWAVPATSIFSGAGDGFGSVSIPEIGTMVFVFFENGDIYQPVYFAQAPDIAHAVVNESFIGYPYSKVLKTKKGTVIVLDDENENMYVTHSSGAFIHVSPEGAVTIYAKDEATIFAGTNVNISAEQDCNIQAGGDCQVSVTGQAQVDASSVTVNALVDANINAANANVIATGEAKVEGTTVGVTATGIVTISGAAVNLN